MHPYSDALREYLCPRPESIPISVNSTVLDAFPTQIKLCVGEKCLRIATVSLQRDTVSGSTQLYHVSEPVLYYFALILSAVSSLAVAVGLWILYRYALGQKGRRSRKVGTGRGSESTVPARKGDPAVTIRDVNQGVFPSSHGLRRPVGKRLLKDRSSPSATSTPIDPILPRTPPLPTASNASEGLPSPSQPAKVASQDDTSDIHPSMQDPKPQWSTGVVSGDKILLQRSAAPTHVRVSSNTDHTNTDPPNSHDDHTTKSPTRDQRTEVPLAKEHNGAPLTHGGKGHLRSLKVPAALKNPPHKHCRETILLKKADGQKLTKGERKFLTKTGPQAGNASESAVSESGISAAVDGSTAVVSSPERGGDEQD